MPDSAGSDNEPIDETVIPAGPESGFDGPLSGVEVPDWLQYVIRSQALMDAERERERNRLANEEINVQEELAERERRLAEYDAAEEERKAARAARAVAEERRVADQRRDRRRFAWQMGAVLTGVVLSAVGVTIAAMAYFAPREAPAPVVNVPAPIVTVLPAPVTLAPPAR